MAGTQKTLFITLQGEVYENETGKKRIDPLVMIIMGVLIACCGWPLTAAFADGSLCAEVQIEIQQDLTLERQAFEARMRINNGLTNITLENVQVTVNFTDEHGEPVAATSNPNLTPDPSDPSAPRFFIRLEDLHNLSGADLDDHLDFSGSVAPSTSADISWLIIPVPGASAGIPQGKLYYVGATLSYTLAGDERVTEVTPDSISVRPMPVLSLDYFMPYEVYGDDAFTPETEPPVPFSLGVRVSNTGHGAARSLRHDMFRI
jgi:hypothetical protein